MQNWGLICLLFIMILSISDRPIANRYDGDVSHLYCTHRHFNDFLFVLFAFALSTSTICISHVRHYFVCIHLII